MKCNMHPGCDKAKWEDGPWDLEPDRVQWDDKATGLTCIIRRHEHLGHWCGYVGIPAGHPWNGLEDEKLPADVHGGVTYTRACDEDPELGVCHVPPTGEPDGLWWVGFDFAHLGDYSPGMWTVPQVTHRRKEHYWTETEVMVEVTQVAAQVAEAGREPDTEDWP